MPEKNDLLDTAIEAHGGIVRWNQARQVMVRVTAGGLALKSRFQSRAFADVEATVSTSTPKVLFDPYPRNGQRGIFEGGAVAIIDREGLLIEERKRPREGFKSLRRNVYWDTLDTLYFGGYALWNYLNLPFLLRRPGVLVAEIDPWTEEGRRLRRLHATFPADIPTHSEEQIFYLDSSGLIVRHDYTAEVFGRWAKAAHYSWDHRKIDGLVIPLRRKAYPRLSSGRPLRHITLVSLKIDTVRIVEDEP